MSDRSITAGVALKVKVVEGRAPEILTKQTYDKTAPSTGLRRAWRALEPGWWERHGTVLPLSYPVQ
jgi:hypothetical protein